MTMAALLPHPCYVKWRRSINPLCAAVSSSTSAAVSCAATSTPTRTPLIAEFRSQAAVFQDPMPLVARDGDQRVALLGARLERVAEKIREAEVEKFMRRGCAAELSAEERVLVEETSNEIIKKFLERPIQYLNSKSCCRGLEEKLEDVEFLLCMLESCVS